MADFNEKLNELNNTKDTTEEFDSSDIENNKVMGILAYISFLVLVPIFGAKESKFARFHANQGLVLLIASVAASTIISVITYSLNILPVVGKVLALPVGLVGFAVSVISTVLMIIGIINAAKGKAKELPFIGGIKILK